ncbi:unnamed protein product [Paramecium sonneborni]|uniref:Uncharacterized protein n=1 Tax=Paramecium sonneborni TaxID=65129 RepID=A0A8S1PPU8_9CILI|nr:unnamed protein product [Paramecium sonneborni]
MKKRVVRLVDGLSQVINFWRFIYPGEYKNGKKIVRWDILWRQYHSQPFQLIGGGTYDQNMENDVKI